MGEKFFTKHLPKWLVFVFIILLIARMPGIIEQFYSRGIYPIMRAIDLFFLRFIPFSVGDVIYLAFPGWFLYQLYGKIKSGQSIMFYIINMLWKIIAWFYLLWGLNYFRVPMYQQMNLDIHNSSEKNFWIIARATADSLNALHGALGLSDSMALMSESPQLISRQAVNIYKRQISVRPYLHQYFYVLKPSLLSLPVSYLGVSGYFNPFTHEAQYNSRYPRIFLPHIMLHELAHQSGIAYENEAEFIAWLTAMEYGDKKFRYATHLNTMEYFLRRYFITDINKYNQLMNNLNGGVIKNLEEARRFSEKYRIRINLTRPYDYYLKVNQQGKGMIAYSELLQYIEAYYRKNNKIINEH